MVEIFDFGYHRGYYTISRKLFAQLGCFRFLPIGQNAGHPLRPARKLPDSNRLRELSVAIIPYNPSMIKKQNMNRFNFPICIFLQKSQIFSNSPHKYNPFRQLFQFATRLLENRQLPLPAFSCIIKDNMI